MTHATTTSIPGATSVGHGTAIAGADDDRPPMLATESRETIRELDAWCRRHDWSASLNPWVAEEAVRRS